MTRLCAVSYLNTKPFLDGLSKYFAVDELQVDTFAPAQCALKMELEQYHAVLIPVGALIDAPSNKEYHILPDYCIGAKGKVDSVFLFANQPVDTIDTVYLDPDSRSSNGLTQVLFANHWNKETSYLSESDYFDKIKGSCAGVVIGDKAVAIKSQYKYVYDLAHEWQIFSGLPFAFAIWVYQPNKTNAQMLNKLKESFEWGVQNIPEVAQKWASHFNISTERAQYYLADCIDYRLDDSKRKAISLYLTLLTQLRGNKLPILHF